VVVASADDPVAAVPAAAVVVASADDPVEARLPPAFAAVPVAEDGHPSGVRVVVVAISRSSSRRN
jgi:flagellar biosynthesis/type III secretory pathway ATPase